MKKRQISIIIIVLTAITAYGQEQLWQQCNENLPGKIRIMPARCSDNNHQVGAKASVEFTLDGDNNTLWHSAFHPEHKKMTPETPAELVYEFENVERIDRMVYVPRQDGSPNGYVTEAEILVKNATGTDFQLVGRYTWDSDIEPKTVRFEGGLQWPTAIMFRVLHGMGDLGSCAEMRFRRDGESLKLCPLFADDLYTALKPNVTDEDIKRTESPIFRELAKQLKNGSYQTAYRVATFDCYDHPLWLSKEWRTPDKFYDQLQGVTGIVVEPGKHLIMVSGLPDGQTTDLKVVAWYARKTGNKFDGSKPELLNNMATIQPGQNPDDEGSGDDEGGVDLGQ